MSATLKEIDEARLHTDIAYRYQYMADFIGITEKDVKLVHGSAAVLGPKVESLVDAVYDKLFSFSCTKKVFFKERGKYDKPSCEATLQNYDQNKPQIGMRKATLQRFIVRLVTKPYDIHMLTELDRMGKIHTPLGGKTSINVQLVHMQTLLAFLQDAILGELFQYKASDEEGAKDFDAPGTARAFCKILAVLGQFISEWYEDPRTQGKAPRPHDAISLPMCVVGMVVVVVAIAVAAGTYSQAM